MMREVRGEQRLPSSLSGTPGILPHCFSRESHFTPKASVTLYQLDSSAFSAFLCYFWVGSLSFHCLNAGKPKFLNPPFL